MTDIETNVNNPRKIAASELIVNPDKSIYHIKLRNEHIADNVILVGDQGRVKMVSDYFDVIENKIENREFHTHTGRYNGKAITVMSTGIGTDNIDIAVNELDAAANIDLESREVKQKLRKLNLVRIGTSGSLQEDIPVDSFLVSEYGIGFDGLLHFYDGNDHILDKELATAFSDQTGWPDHFAKPYIAKGNSELINKLSVGAYSGITATANGFYGPQGRKLRLDLTLPDLNEKLSRFNHNGQRITNFEMETSALYGIGGMLGHNCATICAIIANRYTKTYSEDYKKVVNELVGCVLDKLTA